MNDRVAVKLSAEEARDHMSAAAVNQGLAGQVGLREIAEFAALGPVGTGIVRTGAAHTFDPDAQAAAMHAQQRAEERANMRTKTLTLDA